MALSTDGSHRAQLMPTKCGAYQTYLTTCIFQSQFLSCRWFIPDINCRLSCDRMLRESVDECGTTLSYPGMFRSMIDTLSLINNEYFDLVEGFTMGLHQTVPIRSLSPIPICCLRIRCRTAKAVAAEQERRCKRYASRASSIITLHAHIISPLLVVSSRLYFVLGVGGGDPPFWVCRAAASILAFISRAISCPLFSHSNRFS